MFEGLTGKFGKLKMPDGSLIRKLERIKKSSMPQENEISASLIPEMMEQLRKVPEEISRKIDEVEYKNVDMIKANSRALKNLENRLYNLDQAVLLTKNDTEEFNRRLEKLDKSVLGLVPSHEVISKTVDPINEKIMNIDKRMEDIYNKPPEIPPLFIENLENKFNNLEGQLYNLDQSVLSTKNDTEEFNRRLEKLDKSVLEPLYEVISKTVDPINEKITNIDKRMEDIYNKPPEIPPKFIEDFENKFSNLEKNLDELKKTVESKAIDENAFIERVAVMVVERLRPRKKHRDMYGADTPGTESPVSQVQSGPQAPQYTVENNEEARLGYLDNKPDTSIILLNWIEFLMEKVGRNNLFDVLEYYIEIGWISRDVCSKMMAYASGIDYFVDRPSWKLLPEDHTKSLMFIEQLCGNKVDRMLYSRLERDVNRIIRTSKELSVH